VRQLASTTRGAALPRKNNEGGSFLLTQRSPRSALNLGGAGEQRQAAGVTTLFSHSPRHKRPPSSEELRGWRRRLSSCITFDDCL
jgi:hypothetical protein